MNDIAFLIKDLLKKMKLFKFILPNNSNHLVSRLLKCTLPIVHPPFNIWSGNIYFVQREKCIWTCDVVLNHFEAPSMVKPSTMEELRLLIQRLRIFLEFSLIFQSKLLDLVDWVH